MTSTPDTGAELDAVVERVKQLSEQVMAQAKENGLAWLEGYERMLKTYLEFEEKAASSTGVDWAKTLATTHADFVRQTSEVFLGAMRGQLKS